ncbi:hypothetical protein LA080_000910 [Diaporthe eres]|nr:hypothetical protein LA080_000910 [Diaporthe eres]
MLHLLIPLNVSSVLVLSGVLASVFQGTLEELKAGFRPRAKRGPHASPVAAEHAVEPGLRDFSKRLRPKFLDE